MKVRHAAGVGSPVVCATALLTALLGVAEDAKALGCAVPGGGIPRGTEILIHRAWVPPCGGSLPTPSNCSTALTRSPAGGAGWVLVLLGLISLARTRRSAD